jgi:hypothetical protein
MIPQVQLGGINNAFVDAVSDAKAHEVRMILWPCQWQKCQLEGNLHWQVFEFKDESTNTIPSLPGVYAFLVQPRLAGNLDASYLMYIGKTDRSLRQRCQEYLQETIDPSGRPKIVDTLIRYSGYIYFSCATIIDPAIAPQKIEEELLKALIPPMNSELPAEVRRIMNAF